MDTKYQDYMLYGGETTAIFGTGLGYMFAFIVAFKSSGCHVNPAITVAMALWKRTKISLIPAYIIGQYLGSFVGVALVYLIYQPFLKDYDMVKDVFLSDPRFSFYR